MINKLVYKIGMFVAKNPTQARFRDTIEVYFNLLDDSIIIHWISNAPVGGHDTYTLDDYTTLEKKVKVKNSNFLYTIKEAFNTIKKIIQSAPAGSQFEYGKYTKNFKWIMYKPYREVYGFNLNNMIQSINSVKK